MTIGDRVKFPTNDGWYNSGIIKDMDEKSCLVKVDNLGDDDHPVIFPFCLRVPWDVLIAEYEKTESEVTQNDKCRV